MNFSTILQLNRNVLEHLYNKWIVANESADIPCVADMYESITVFHKVLLFFSIVPCLIVCTLGFFHLYFFTRYISNEGMRSNLYFIIMIPPITVAASLLGMFIPRAASFLYAVITTYYMLSLYMIIDLMYLLFGGRKALVSYLEENSIMISLSLSYNCCRMCLPDVKPTLDNLLRIDACILQTVIVRILMQVCELVTYFELRSKNHMFFTLSNFINIVSMYISTYFGYVLVNAGKDKLKPYHVGLLFNLHDYLLAVPAILKAILDFAVDMEWIGHQKLMPPESMAMFYFNFLLILANLVISLYATYAFRFNQTVVYDDPQENKKPSSGEPDRRLNEATPNEAMLESGKMQGYGDAGQVPRESVSSAKNDASNSIQSATGHQNSSSLRSSSAGEESVPLFVVPPAFPPSATSDKFDS